MTTPTPDAVPSEEFRIKRLREWAFAAMLRQPGSSIIERTVAEDVQHLEAKYQRDLAARDAELAAMKEAHAEQLRAVLARELVYANAQTAMKQRAVAAEQERDSAVSWNHRVSVCEKHTAEIVDGPCVICELEAAERKAEEAARDAERWQMHLRLLHAKHGAREVRDAVDVVNSAIAAKGEA